MGCIDGQKALYAAYKLTGLAARWWETKKELLNGELRGVEISWAVLRKNLMIDSFLKPNSNFVPKNSRT
jgi:hypothetical protein